jgi:hypothetical protein
LQLSTAATQRRLEREHARASGAAAGAPHVHPHADLVASGLLELAVAAVLGLDVATRRPRLLRRRGLIFVSFLAATGRRQRSEEQRQQEPNPRAANESHTSPIQIRS